MLFFSQILRSSSSSREENKFLIAFYDVVPMTWISKSRQNPASFAYCSSSGREGTISSVIKSIIFRTCFASRLLCLWAPRESKEEKLQRSEKETPAWSTMRASQQSTDTRGSGADTHTDKGNLVQLRLCRRRAGQKEENTSRRWKNVVRRAMGGVRWVDVDGTEHSSDVSLYFINFLWWTKKRRTKKIRNDGYIASQHRAFGSFFSLAWSKMERSVISHLRTPKAVSF